MNPLQYQNINNFLATGEELDERALQVFNAFLGSVIVVYNVYRQREQDKLPELNGFVAMNILAAALNYLIFQNKNPRAEYRGYVSDEDFSRGYTQGTVGPIRSLFNRDHHRLFYNVISTSLYDFPQEVEATMQFFKTEGLIPAESSEINTSIEKLGFYYARFELYHSLTKDLESMTTSRLFDFLLEELRAKELLEDDNSDKS
jgi:hypothetical protein